MRTRSQALRNRTTTRDDRIVALYAQELTLPEIARRLRSSIDTARMVLKERGVRRRRKTDAWSELRARNDYIVEAYKGGIPLAEIAQEANLSIDGVLFILKVRGVARDRTQRQQRENRARDLKIAAAYRRGKTIKEAGAEVGLGFGGAREALLRLKVPIRTSGVGRKLPEQERWKEMRRKIAAAAELYTRDGLTTAEIGRRLGFQAHTVSKNLRRMGIPIRTGKSTLTEPQVHRIREELIEKKATPRKLAEKYGMSTSAIRDIGKGVSWGEVAWRTKKRYVPKGAGKAKGKKGNGKKVGKRRKASPARKAGGKRGRR